MTENKKDRLAGAANPVAESTKPEPAKVDPAKVDPAKAEPAKAEPAKAEPTKVEPTKADPTKADPTKADPAKAEPAKAEPAKAEPTPKTPPKTETQKPARLLLLLGEYLGFSLLCGWVSMLFFVWAAQVISNNYALRTGAEITIGAEYALELVSVLAGLVIAVFALTMLLQRKFSYIVQLSRMVEQMESGDLSCRIPLTGQDELTDLAAGINRLAAAWQTQLGESGRLNQEQLQAIALLAHDLRTPLTSVMSYLELIRDHGGQNPEQLQLYAARACDQAGRIKQMSDSLFDRCAPAAASAAAAGTPNGAKALEQALQNAARTLRESGFLVELSAELQNSVFALKMDSSGLLRLVDNLVSNIQKYADPAQPVCFAVKIAAPRVLLRQSNTPRPKSEAQQQESHGLGLKSVEQSLRQTGGSMAVSQTEEQFLLEIALAID